MYLVLSMSLIFMVEKEMCHEHNEPQVDTLYLVPSFMPIYSSSASADVNGSPNIISMSKFLILPLCTARLAIFLIMQALFL